MTSTHLHLLLNHIPILGALFGLLLLAIGMIRKSQILQQAGMITFIVVSIITVPAFLTGEEAEETVEDIPTVSEFFIEQHEELAEVALWLMIATGIAALATLIVTYMKDKKSRVLTVITLLIAIGTFGVMVAVGNYGGKIRHTEIRDKTTINQPLDTNQGEEIEENEDD